jgi:hypothetical protein
MHGIEIVLHDDSSSTVVIQDNQDSSCRCVGKENSVIDSGSLVDATNEMSSRGQPPSIQQAAAITKAPLIVAANKAKNGLNITLAKLNNGVSTLISFHASHKHLHMGIVSILFADDRM